MSRARFKRLRQQLDSLEVCQRCNRSFEPSNRPGLAACPHCGSYLRWSELLAGRATVAQLRTLIPPPQVAPSPTESEPAHVEVLRQLYRKQQRLKRRKGKTRDDM